MQDVKELIDQLNIVFALGCKVDGSAWHQFGDDNNIIYKGLLRKYFSSEGKVEKTKDFLTKTTLPFVDGLNGEYCVLSLDQHEMIWAFFVQADHDEEQMKEVAQAIQKVIEEIN